MAGTEVAGERIDGMAADLLAASRSSNLAEVVVTRAAEALGGYAAYFGAIDAVNGVLRARAFHGFSPSLARTSAELSLDGEGPASLVARTGRPLVIGSAEEYAAVFPGAWTSVGRLTHTRAFVYVPVLAHDRSITTVGVLGVSFDRDRKASADDVAVLEAVARFASRAVT